MKKLALLLALAIITLAACADQTVQTDAPPAAPSPSEAPSEVSVTAEEPRDDVLPQSPRTPVTGILEEPGRAWTGIRFFGGIYTDALSPVDAEEVFRILSTMDAEEVLTPYHYESQQSDPMFKIFIDYDDGSVETIDSTETGRYFFRYTGTEGEHGDPGYIGGFSEELFDILDRLQ
jgi:hypothetical protein